MKRVRIGGDPLRLRQASYMPPGDQLDAIAKGFRYLQRAHGLTFPPETLAWLEHCEKVKAQRPKPAPAQPRHD